VLPILRSNIGMNMPRLPPDAGRVHIRELDWMVPPEDWRWNDTERIASPVMIGNSNSISVDTDYLRPPFDLIVTTDTIYHPDLGDPLLRTLHHLVRFSVEKGTTPRTFLALERRDPALVDSVLRAAIDKWGFKLEAVPRRRLSKALEKAGMKWPREDWDGVEVWKMSLSSIPLRSDKQ
jgi:protein N-lysine methyltransferase METTL21D